MQLLPLQALVEYEPECCFGLSEHAVPRKLHEVGAVDSVELALAKVTLAGGQEMAWKQTTPFMSIPDYVADHSILETTAGLLSSLCSSMKIKKHGKLSHRRRFELFLQEMGRSEEYISSVLEEIPMKERPAENEQAMNLDPHEQ